MTVSIEKPSFRFSHWEWLLLIGISAFLLRILLAVGYRNGFDLNPYNIPWALGTQEGVFSIYKNLENLDYPPLFPFLLSLVGKGVALGKELDSWPIQMLFIKLIPVLFDVGNVLLLYWIGCRRSQSLGMLLSALWAGNVSMILNCSLWGQTDSLLLFFVLFTFWQLWENRPGTASICFALGSLTKLQMAYFAPILLFELLTNQELKVACRSLILGLLTGILGWLPFIIGSGDWFLPLRIYFGGFGKYSYVNVNAYNLYGIWGGNWLTDQASVIGGSYSETYGVNIGGFTYSHLSMFFLGLIFLLILAGYFVSLRFNRKIPAALPALMLLNGIFMLSTKMHERYQLPVMGLALLCLVFTENKNYIWYFLALTIVTCINQGMVLFQANHGDIFKSLFSLMQSIFSIFNLILFLMLLWQYITTVFWARSFFLQPLKTKIENYR